MRKEEALSYLKIIAIVVVHSTTRNIVPRTMRLLNTKTFKLEFFVDEQSVPPYAILFHTWDLNEVTLLTCKRIQICSSSKSLLNDSLPKMSPGRGKSGILVFRLLNGGFDMCGLTHAVSINTVSLNFRGLSTRCIDGTRKQKYA